jgi:hypothetical protein
MQISEKELEQFKLLYQKRWGESLSDENAFRKALSLLKLYRAIYGLPNVEYLENEKEEVE